MKFTLPWIPHGGYSHVFVAKKLGYWEKRGLDVTVDRGFGSGEVCKTLGLGQYEFGSLDLGVMVNCVGKGLDLVATGGLSPRSPVGIFSLAKKGIKINNKALDEINKTLFDKSRSNKKDQPGEYVQILTNKPRTVFYVAVVTLPKFADPVRQVFVVGHGPTLTSATDNRGGLSPDPLGWSISRCPSSALLRC